MSEEKKCIKSEEVREGTAELTPEEVAQVTGGADLSKIEDGKSRDISVLDAADILQERDIISRAAEERCDVLFGNPAEASVREKVCH